MSGPQNPRVTVTQEDRDAAAERIAIWGDAGAAWEASRVRAGERDDHGLVQAFARHREAAEAEAEAREAALESLLREAAMGLSCLSFKPLDTDIAQAAPLVARINAALTKEPGA